MEEFKRLLEEYNKPLTKEQLEKIIYNIFCIIIFSAPIIPEAIGFGIYSLKNTIFIFSTIITSLVLTIMNRKNLKTNVYDKLLIAYMALVLLSTIFTKFGIVECIFGTNGRGEGLLTIFSYVATFVIFSRGYKHMQKLSKVAIIAAMIVCAYSFLQANRPAGVTLPFFTNSPAGVATGTMRNQNFLSSYICIFLPMSCYYYINGKSKIKRSLVIVALLFMTQLYSVTLGGYITFGVMYAITIIFSIWFSEKKKDTIIRIVILSIVLFAIFTLVNYEESDKYTKEISVSKQEVTNLVKKEDKFGSGRMEIWKKALMLVNDYTLLGVGPDSMAKANREDKYITKGEQDILVNQIVDKTHCEPLQIAVTTGIPSSIIYIILVGTIGIKLLVLVINKTKKDGIDNNNTRYITMILICFASYLMQSVINISVVQVAPLFWAVLGTVAGILENNKAII